MASQNNFRLIRLFESYLSQLLKRCQNENLDIKDFATDCATVLAEWTEKETQGKVSEQDELAYTAAVLDSAYTIHRLYANFQESKLQRHEARFDASLITEIISEYNNWRLEIAVHRFKIGEYFLESNVYSNPGTVLNRFKRIEELINLSLFLLELKEPYLHKANNKLAFRKLFVWIAYLIPIAALIVSIVSLLKDYTSNPAIEVVLPKFSLPTHFFKSL